MYALREQGTVASLIAASPDVDSLIRTMIGQSRSQLVERLLEALSLALCCESQNPSNPITRAALQHTVQDALAEIEMMNGKLKARPEQ
jgi:hypothetical protein